MSFVHLSHLVRQLSGKLTPQSKLNVSDSTNLFDIFTHDVPQICTTHCEDPALQVAARHSVCSCDGVDQLSHARDDYRLDESR